MEAFDILEGERCSCGYPVYICQSGSGNVQWRTVESTCYAAKRREEDEEKLTQGDKKRPKGVILKPEPFSVDGSPLSELRKPYYEDQAKKRQARMESQ